MIERRYTFVLQYQGDEDEEFEGQFEDGLDHVLATATFISGAPPFDLQLLSGEVREAKS